MTTAATIPSFNVPAEMMQGILSTVGSMPWSQVNGLMVPLVQLVQQQQADFEQSKRVDAPAA